MDKYPSLRFLDFIQLCIMSSAGGNEKLNYFTRLQQSSAQLMAGPGGRQEKDGWCEF